jgi:hypothetical protein
LINKLAQLRLEGNGGGRYHKPKREYETNENRRNRRKSAIFVCFVYFRLFRILSWACDNAVETESGALKGKVITAVKIAQFY